MLPETKFAKLWHLPDPIPGNDDHYKPFGEVFSTRTMEDYCPSKAKSKWKTLPLHPSVQHVRNTQMMLLCEECSVRRLIYSKQKLKQVEKTNLLQALNGMSFSCGAQLQDANILEHLKYTVFICQMACEQPVEKLYYFAESEDIRVHCSGDVDPWSDLKEYYPQCEGCSAKTKIPNAKDKKKLIFYCKGTFTHYDLLG